jgi:hypothetical protein
MDTKKSIEFWERVVKHCPVFKPTLNSLKKREKDS